jgi:hypothetical protein
MAVPKTKTRAAAVDYEAHFAVPIPTGVVYMHNVLLTFANNIPDSCHPYCLSAKHPSYNGPLNGEMRQVFLRDFVEERLGQLADLEYRGWINGQQPFVTPRELQIWRLRQFVQYVWFWNLPDDDDLAMIFNLTKRRAGNLAADFIARFRKTVIYPAALRRVYHLINTSQPVFEKPEKHPRHNANGYIYKVPTRRLVDAAQNLVDDIHTELPNKKMDAPYLWDRELNYMWMDVEAVDVIKTNDELRQRLYAMYKIPDQ